MFFVLCFKESKLVVDHLLLSSPLHKFAPATHAPRHVFRKSNGASLWSSALEVTCLLESNQAL
jgi:hypothetical protein